MHISRIQDESRECHRATHQSTTIWQWWRVHQQVIWGILEEQWYRTSENGTIHTTTKQYSWKIQLNNHWNGTHDDTASTTTTQSPPLSAMLCTWWSNYVLITVSITASAENRCYPEGEFDSECTFLTACCILSRRPL